LALSLVIGQFFPGIVGAVAVTALEKRYNKENQIQKEVANNAN
jgi:hypothetical protein